MAVDAENCDPMNLYRWPEGAHVKNLEIDPRLLCTGQKWSYLCSLLVRFCLLRSPFRDAVGFISHISNDHRMVRECMGFKILSIGALGGS